MCRKNFRQKLERNYKHIRIRRIVIQKKNNRKYLSKNEYLNNYGNILINFIYEKHISYPPKIILYKKKL